MRPQRPETSRLMGLGTVVSIREAAVTQAHIFSARGPAGGAIYSRYHNDPRCDVAA